MQYSNSPNYTCSCNSTGAPPCVQSHSFPALLTTTTIKFYCTASICSSALHTSILSNACTSCTPSPYECSTFSCHMHRPPIFTNSVSAMTLMLNLGINWKYEVLRSLTKKNGRLGMSFWNSTNNSGLMSDQVYGVTLPRPCCIFFCIFFLAFLYSITLDQIPLPCTSYNSQTCNIIITCC